MNKIVSHIKNQLHDTHNWANKLIQGLKDEKWFHTPGTIESNIAWQIGHLTLSQYYYTVVLLHGPDRTFSDHINMKKYSSLFVKGDHMKELSSQVSVAELEEKWNLMQDHTIDAIADLKDEELYENTFTTTRPHPFVRTIEESLSWNIKHTMWHCGQIGLIKRVVDERFDFGF